MYYLKTQKQLLNAPLDAEVGQMLGYTNQYNYGDLLIPFEYNGEFVNYIELTDGVNIIVQLRLPSPNHAIDENNKIYDRALNKCIKGDIQKEWLYYCYGKFGKNNILESLENIK